MEKKWSEYTEKLKLGKENFEEIIQEARKDYGIKIDLDFNEHKYNEKSIKTDVPFNLERKYFEFILFEKKDYILAKQIIERMRQSYTDVFYQNSIEIYDYTLQAAKHSEETLKNTLSETKKDFNQQIITLTGIIVGIVTILGAATQTLIIKDFDEGINTFFAIVFAIVFLVAIALIINKKFTKK